MSLALFYLFALALSTPAPYTDQCPTCPTSDVCPGGLDSECDTPTRSCQTVHCSGGCCIVANDGACPAGTGCVTKKCDPSAVGADAYTGCVDVLNDASCEDGFSCTENICLATGACQTTNKNDKCNDNIACTTDVCSPTTSGACPASGCVYTSNCGAAASQCQEKFCIDGYCVTANKAWGTSCTGADSYTCTADVCDGNGNCIARPDHSQCNDYKPCTIDLCEPANRNDATNPNSGCKFVNKCVASDQCHTTECQTSGCVESKKSVGTACADSDGLDCTTGQCDANGNCQPTPSNTACDDDLPCTTDTCVTSGVGCLGCKHDSTCTAPAVPECQTVSCKTPTLAVPSGCFYYNIREGQSCTDNDGIACTTGVCTAGVCVATERNNLCDDHNCCTSDICDIDSHGCTTGSTVTCNSPPECHGPGSCNPNTGACVYPPTSGGACADTDNNPCTKAVCDNGVCNQNVATNEGGTCTDTDGNVCTTAKCYSGTCTQNNNVANGPVAGCSDTDNNPCTKAECYNGQCSQTIATNEGGTCTDTDGNVCTTAKCYSGTCTQNNNVANGPVTGCTDTDNNPCTKAECYNGQCSQNIVTNNGGTCTDTDSNTCTTAKCYNGQCTQNNPVNPDVTISVTLQNCNGDEAAPTAQLKNAAGQPTFNSAIVTMTQQLAPNQCTWKATITGIATVTSYVITISNLPSGYGTGATTAAFTLNSPTICHKDLCLNITPLPSCGCHTIGYWKNWNSCAGTGGQTDQMSLALANSVDGIDIAKTSAGVVIAHIYKTGDCPKAVWILTKGGENNANIANSVAAQSLAAQLNLLAGFCGTSSFALPSPVPALTYARAKCGVAIFPSTTTVTIGQVVTCAIKLLGDINYACPVGASGATTCTIGTAPSSANGYTQALSDLNTVLNDYNNRRLCTNVPSTMTAVTCPGYP